MEESVEASGIAGEASCIHSFGRGCVAWFRAKVNGYQTKVNGLLRKQMLEEISKIGREAAEGIACPRREIRERCPIGAR